MHPVVTGSVLIEAPGAALNNAGQAAGTRAENAVVVKYIRIGRLRYPYVSGQAWRRWWREVLYADFGWEPSPVTVTRNPQQGYTAGDPIRYAEDDLFGYMVARRRRRETREGTYRRISPLKASLLISVLPNVITDDFGHFTRNLPPGEDPILYETQHYTALLQGVFTISLADVGRFVVGEMCDLSEDMVQAHAGELEQPDPSSPTYRLTRGERAERVAHALQALARLRGGAHLARNLADVSPVCVLVGFLDGGNAPFQNLFCPDENHEAVRLNVKRLLSVLEDYQDRWLGERNGPCLFFGYRPTVLENEGEVLRVLREDERCAGRVEVVGTPQQALERAAAYAKQVLDREGA